MKRYIMVLIAFLFVSCGGDTKTTPISKKEKKTPINQSWYKLSKDTTWQWQLLGKLNQNYDVDVYDIDLFDTNTTVIKSLQDSGKKVICYFSAGSFEDWRDDAKDFPKDIIGKQLDGWAGEKWLDISSKKLEPLMKARLDIAKEKGCDGVEPDNVDGYTNESGFPLSSKHQIEYNTFLAKEAHKRGLSIGLKNDLSQIKTLEPLFDFAVNEQCHEYEECDLLKPFIEANKPVFNAEYDRTKKDKFCQESLIEEFQTLILPLELDDSFRLVCN